MFPVFALSHRVALLLGIALHCLVAAVSCETPTVVHPSLRFISPDNPFRENLAVNISIEDVRARLNAAQNLEPTRTTKRGPKIIEYKLDNPTDKSLAKRAVYGPEPYGPLIDFKTCLDCEGKAKRDGTLSVANNFMADQMVAKMSIFATIGTCLFYGQRPPGAKPHSLSDIASEYACSFGGLAWRTIWHLWPSEGYDTDKNYYCLNARAPRCCWLNPLMPGQNIKERVLQSMLYFQQMSRAMALTCKGEVFTLMDDPEDINKPLDNEYPSIWLTHELPVLRGLFQQGTVTKLWAIRLSNKERVDVTGVLETNNPRDVEIDWDEPLARAVKAKELEFLKTYGNLTAAEEAAKLHRRAVCGSAADQEDPELDYFG